MTAKFISFEGTEGVGKTTLIDNIEQYFIKSHIDYIRTREPGGSPFAEQLREILLNPEQKMVNDSELLLIFSARADHLQTVILPALADGKWVLCDRFTDSTIAYQGFGRQHGNPEYLTKIDLLIEQFIPRLPDMTLWLDLPVVEGMKRAKKRGELDRFEQQDIDFFQRANNGFAQQAEKFPERFFRLNADSSTDEVFNNTLKILGFLV